MPATSKAQLRFMQAVAHNRKFARKAGVPQSVGREFSTLKPGAPARAPARKRKARKS